MGFFTARERAELGKSAEIRVQGTVRELHRQDYAPRRRPADNPLTGHVGTLMKQVAESSLREIDDLIVELRKRREKLLGESARMQREIIAYARLNQSTVESTKIITESLASLKKIPDAPSMSELHREHMFNEQSREDEPEAFAQPGEDHGTFGAQAEEAEIPGRPDWEAFNRPA